MRLARSAANRKLAVSSVTNSGSIWSFQLDSTRDNRSAAW
jgi:hypothetical protein